MAAEGEQVAFVCEADGKPPPNIQWIHNEVPIEKHTYMPNRMVSDTQIIISDLKESDTGKYSVLYFTVSFINQIFSRLLKNVPMCHIIQHIT